MSVSTVFGGLHCRERIFPSYTTVSLLGRRTSGSLLKDTPIRDGRYGSGLRGSVYVMHCVWSLPSAWYTPTVTQNTGVHTDEVWSVSHPYSFLIHLLSPPLSHPRPSTPTPVRLGTQERFRDVVRPGTTRVDPLPDCWEITCKRTNSSVLWTPVVVFRTWTKQFKDLFE